MELRDPTTTQDEYFTAMIHVRDCDDDPGTVEVTASPEEFGTDVGIETKIEGWVTSVWLTPEDVVHLINSLTAAVEYATAH